MQKKRPAFRKLLIAAIVLLAFVLLFPRWYEIDDGGSIAYMAPLYCVTKYHMMDFENGGYRNGWGVEILGMQVYRRLEPEIRRDSNEP